MAITFLKKGKEAHSAFEADEKAAKARKASLGPRRFWVPVDKEARVTFLDGKLDADGLLEINSFDQHNIKLNGRWNNFFVCTAENEPCPLCEDGFASRVALFTVLDHTTFTDRKGKVHKNERKLFVAKRETLNRLQKLAAKRGGLRGWTVSIGRYGERSAEVGTDFDFEEKHNLKELAAELGLQIADVRPFNYEEEIGKLYKTADELRELGLGSKPVGRADTTKVLGKKSKAKSDDDDFDDDIDDDDDGDDDDDAPPPRKAKPAKAAKAVKPGKKAAPPPDDDDIDADLADDDDGGAFDADGADDADDSGDDDDV